MVESYNVQTEENTSGQGKGTYVPPEVLGKFNWGAFFLNWIWGIGNFVWLALIALALGFVPFVGGIASLAFCIWLGIKGNELAWQSKQWKSVEHFHKVQKTWAIVGIIIGGVGSVLMVIGIIAAMIIPTLMNSTSDQQFKVATKKAISITNQAAQLNFAKEIPTSGYYSNGQELAQYFSQSMKGEIDGKKIKTSDGMVYQFEANGDCTGKSCMVIVDLNGMDKGPNKYWEVGGTPSDRIVLYLNKGKYGLEVTYPEQLEQME